MTDVIPKTCPHCGEAAMRITPMGFWEPNTGYGPSGVRYVCGALYQFPPKQCPGNNTSYGIHAEEQALKDWNTRVDPSVKED